MAEKIKLVQGDTRPIIRLTLKQANGSVLDVSAATVAFHFRAAGSETVLATIPCSFETDGSNGAVLLQFPVGTLNVEPGQYEGEVEVDFGGGERQTVYEVLKFQLRAQFA